LRIERQLYRARELIFDIFARYHVSLARLQSLGPSSVYTSIDAFGFTEDPPRLNSGEAVLALVDVHLKTGGAVILVVRTPPRPEGLPDVM
jgi:hypothetical protein